MTANDLGPLGTGLFGVALLISKLTSNIQCISSNVQVLHLVMFCCG